MVHFNFDDDPEVIVIHFEYEAGTRDPGRLFRSMATLVAAFHSLDRDLARAVSVDVTADLVLERVEAGSFRGVFRTLLLQVDDDALHNLEWRPLVGQYLVRAKHALIRWLAERERIETRTEILGLRDDLARLAPAKTAAELLPPATVPVERLLRDIQAISEGVQELRESESVTLVSVFEQTEINLGFRLTTDEIEMLLTQEVISSQAELILPVKKPDYLGNSRWEFRYGDHIIEARVRDDAWLERFRAGEIVLKPGDALRALVRAEVSRGFEGNVVATKYEILEVRRVVSEWAGEQQRLPE